MNLTYFRWWTLSESLVYSIEYLTPSFLSRAVPDHPALVPDIICQCGGHPSAPQDLGPAVLPGLIGTLPGHTGHAQDQGICTAPPISSLASLMQFPLYFIESFIVFVG